MLGGLSFISVYQLFASWGKAPLSIPSIPDLIYLLILGIICTAYAFAVQVNVMKHLSAYIVVLTINLEPVYGIIMAWFLFGETEHMTQGFYVGTSIIIISVLGFPIFHFYKRKKLRQQIML